MSKLSLQEEQRRQQLDTPTVQSERRFNPDQATERAEPDTSTVKRSRFLDGVMNAESAAIDSYINGGTVVEYLGNQGEVGTGDSKSRLMTKSGEKGSTDKDLVAQELFRNPGNNPLETSSHISEATLMESEIEEDSYDYHKQAAESFGSFKLTEEQQASLNVAFTLNEMLDPLRERIDWTDYAKMFVAPILLPGYETYTKAQLTGSIFQAARGWDNIVTNFHQLSPKKKVEMFPFMMQHILDGTIDEVSALDSLERLIRVEDQDFFLNPIWAVADVIGIAGTAKAAVKIAGKAAGTTARLSKKLNAVKILKNSSRHEEAEEISAAGMVDKSDNAIGQTKVERKDNAMPFNQHAGSVEDAQAARTNTMDIVSKGDEKAPGYVAGVASKTAEKLGDARAADDVASRQAAIDTSTAARREPDDLDTLIENLKNDDSMDNFDAYVAGIERGVREGTLINRETMIDPISRRALEDKFEKQLVEETFENGVVTVTDRVRKNVETVFHYSRRAEDGSLEDGVFSMQLTLNKVGTWDISDASMTGKLLLSNQALANKFAKNVMGKAGKLVRGGSLLEDVKSAQRAEQKGAKLEMQFQRLQDMILKELTRGKIGGKWKKQFVVSTAKINDALMAGDMYRDAATGKIGKRFTLTELRDGSWATSLDSDKLRPSSNLEALDGPEISAYFKLRRLYDMEWNMRNAGIRDEYTMKGFRGVQFTVPSIDDTGELIETAHKVVAKPYENYRSAMLAMNEFIAPTKTKSFFNSVNGKMEQAGEVAMKRHYDTGYRLVKADGRIKVGGDLGEVDFVLVNQKKIGELPGNVITYNEGYVPHYHLDGAVWVKETKDTLINGVPGKTVTTKNFWRTRKEADDWIAKQGDDADKFRSVEDGEMAAWAHEQRYVLGGDTNIGSMHTGMRADETPVYGPTQQYNMMPPLQAMNRSLGNLSKFVSHNEWIMGVKQRWVNTANALTDGHPVIKEFGQHTENIENIAAGRFLNHWAKQIEIWEGFQPPSHKAFENTMQTVYEWMQTSKYPGTEWISPAIWRAKDINPVNSAKSLAFHNFLGWFNPVQMFVQGQGGIVALGMNLTPERIKWIPQILLEQNALRIIINDPHASNLAKVAKTHGLEPSYLKTLKDEYLETGMDDGIRTTADYEAGLTGVSQGADAMRSVADSGLWPYRAGEKFTRRVAWLTAYKEAQATRGTATGANRAAAVGDAVPVPPSTVAKAKVGTANAVDEVADIFDTEARNAVHSRAVDLTMNMGKANAAAWQKGIFGVTTQFQQITSKSLEAVTGANGAFTPSERLRLGLGQLFAYGAAGVPLGTMGISYVGSMLGQQAVDEMHPAVVEAINGGFMDSMFFLATGIEVEAAQRGALAGGIEAWLKGVLSDDTSKFEWLLGPSGNVVGKGWTALINALQPLLLGAPDASIVDVPVALGSMIKASISSFSNAQKAVLIERHGKVYDKQGNTIIQGLDTKAALVKAFGFTLGEESKYYKLKELERASRELSKTVSQVIVREMNELYRKGWENVTNEELKILSNRHSYYMSLLYDDERIRVQKNRLETIGADPKIKEVYESYIRYHSRGISDATIRNPAILQGMGLIQSKDLVFADLPGGKNEVK